MPGGGTHVPGDRERAAAEEAANRERADVPDDASRGSEVDTSEAPPEMPRAALHVAQVEHDAIERRCLQLERRIHDAAVAVQLLGDTLRAIAGSGDHDALTLKYIAQLGAQHADNAMREMQR